MAVGTHDYFVDVGDALHEGANPLPILPRHGVSHRIRNVDGRRPRLDGRVDHLTEKIRIRPAGIFTRELHIVRVPAGPPHGPDRRLHHLLPAHLQLVLHVDVRGGDEGVDPGPLRVLQGLPGPVDVLLPGAAQAGNRDPLPNILGDDLDGLEVIRGGDGEPRLDDINAQSGQLAGQLQLLPCIHAVPGRLLSVA